MNATNPHPVQLHHTDPRSDEPQDWVAFLREMLKPGLPPRLDIPDAPTTVTVRDTPRYAGIKWPRTEAVGRIDPATAADLLARFDAVGVPANGLHVDAEGRVFVTLVIGPEEARHVGTVVAKFVAERHPELPAPSVALEDAGDGMFRPVVVFPGGGRFNLPIGLGRVHTRAYGEEMAWLFRPTVIPAAKAGAAAA